MNKFEKEVWDSLQKLSSEYEGYCGRFTDTSALTRISGYSLVQPGDFYFIREGRTFVVECKMITKKNAKSFELRYVRERQHDEMMKMDNAGAFTCYLINDRTTPRAFKTYLVDGESMDDYLFSYHKRSLSWNTLMEEHIMIPRVYPKQWDLNYFVAFDFDGFGLK